MTLKIPIRYLPKGLTKSDKEKQIKLLLKSKRLYKNKKYFTRSKIASYPHKVSTHVKRARQIYNIKSLVPSAILAKRTGCSLKGLKQIVRKGEGAYFSSGSRPSQTAQSWGIARLASSITGGKASAVDLDILEKECIHTGKAYRMAIKTKGYGRRSTKHIRINKPS
jgi:hypothetical protein